MKFFITNKLNPDLTTFSVKEFVSFQNLVNGEFPFKASAEQSYNRFFHDWETYEGNPRPIDFEFAEYSNTSNADYSNFEINLGSKVATSEFPLSPYRMEIKFSEEFDINTIQKLISFDIKGIIFNLNSNAYSISLRYLNTSGQEITRKDVQFSIQALSPGLTTSYYSLAECTFLDEPKESVCIDAFKVENLFEEKLQGVFNYGLQQLPNFPTDGTHKIGDHELISSFYDEVDFTARLQYFINKDYSTLYDIGDGYFDFLIATGNHHGFVFKQSYYDKNSETQNDTTIEFLFANHDSESFRNIETILFVDFKGDHIRIKYQTVDGEIKEDVMSFTLKLESRYNEDSVENYKMDINCDFFEDPNDCPVKEVICGSNIETELLMEDYLLQIINTGLSGYSKSESFRSMDIPLIEAFKKDLEFEKRIQKLINNHAYGTNFFRFKTDNTLFRNYSKYIEEREQNKDFFEVKFTNDEDSKFVSMVLDFTPNSWDTGQGDQSEQLETIEEILCVDYYEYNTDGGSFMINKKQLLSYGSLCAIKEVYNFNTTYPYNVVGGKPIRIKYKTKSGNIATGYISIAFELNDIKYDAHQSPTCEFFEDFDQCSYTFKGAESFDSTFDKIINDIFADAKIRVSNGENLQNINISNFSSVRALMDGAFSVGDAIEYAGSYANNSTQFPFDIQNASYSIGNWKSSVIIRFNNHYSVTIYPFTDKWDYFSSGSGGIEDFVSSSDFKSVIPVRSIWSQDPGKISLKHFDNTFNVDIEMRFNVANDVTITSNTPLDYTNSNLLDYCSIFNAQELIENTPTSNGNFASRAPLNSFNSISGTGSTPFSNITAKSITSNDFTSC